MWGLWLPVVGYVALIFAVSSIPDLAPPRPVANTDKIAHFFEYGILGLLLFRAFTHTWRRGRWRTFLTAVLVGAALAAADEVYQGTVGRTQSLADWTADLAGLCVGSLLMAGRRRGNRGNQGNGEGRKETT